jgi:hypothetical protein
MDAKNRRVDLIVAKQIAGATGIFGSDQLNRLENSQRPQSDVLEVADGRGNDE